MSYTKTLLEKKDKDLGLKLVILSSISHFFKQILDFFLIRTFNFYVITQDRLDAKIESVEKNMVRREFLLMYVDILYNITNAKFYLLDWIQRTIQCFKVRQDWSQGKWNICEFFHPSIFPLFHFHISYLYLCSTFLKREHQLRFLVISVFKCPNPQKCCATIITLIIDLCNLFDYF